MSLDYIFVKSATPTTSIDELVEDASFRLKDYKELASRLFPGINLASENSTQLSINESLLEVQASDASLTVRVRGLDASPEVVFALAAQCQNESIVVVDAQTSELVTAEDSAKSAEEYTAWYRSVLNLA